MSSDWKISFEIGSISSFLSFPSFIFDEKFKGHDGCNDDSDSLWFLSINYFLGWLYSELFEMGSLGGGALRS